MNKKSVDLISDIYGVLKNPQTQKEITEQLNDVSTSITETLSKMLGRDSSIERKIDPLKVYPTELGETCDRKIWYSRNYPGYATPHEDATHMKFMYGNILEEVILHLAEIAGHEVTHKQASLKVEISDFNLDNNPIILSGRIDALVDGEITEVKVVSNKVFDKFKSGTLDFTNDDFGYLSQLDAYYGYASSIEHFIDGTIPDIPFKHPAAKFLVLNKQTGELWQYYPFEDTILDPPINSRIRTINKAIRVAKLSGDSIPPRLIEDEGTGKRGNRKLNMKCTFCPYKKHCWSDSNGGYGLRAFEYSFGTVYLTKVEELPRVIELPV